MKYYVNGKLDFDGNGTQAAPFRRISQAAAIAKPGDEVLVMPGVYREYVDPAYAGTPQARITYRSTEPLGAVITGAEPVTGWMRYQENQNTETGKTASGTVWTTRVNNGIFGNYNPYTTYVYGDWYFAERSRHTGAVYLNDKMLYEARTLEECIEGGIYPCSWEPEASRCKWYAEQDPERNETILYANFQDKDPNKEKIEINVRRECFMPSKTGVGYLTVSGFRIEKAATTWAPPAAFQDCMIGPHWSKGWIIEDCEISNSKCAGIGLGKYLDPENDHYFTYRQVKSPTQMERDAVCRGQYHGWLKEKIGGHIIRRNNIHNCEQGGIIGRMGGVFSIIEDNHIHHINNMMELGGAEIAGIKMHAAIDVIMRRNHIHHCTMGIWCDWEAQGTRITQNLLHDNQKPDFAGQLQGGMMSQDLFVEVSHGPTLIDNNILLSDVALRFATQGVAMVHNLICGAFTCVGGGTAPRYTPYHIPHRTEVMGFMTFLHGDDRFYNNIFVQKWPKEPFRIIRDSGDGDELENRQTGTAVFDEYPTWEEWISNFDFDHFPNMHALAPVHESHLPVWAAGNVYLNGSLAWKKETNRLVEDKTMARVELEEKDGRYYLQTNVYEIIQEALESGKTEGVPEFHPEMIYSDLLGKAFEPEERFENPDGSGILFDYDYRGDHRGPGLLPGPFASKESAQKTLF